MKTILVTGAAGFIGARTTELLLENNNSVIGIDNLNDAYDVRLKQHRLSNLETNENFSFHKIDIENKSALTAVFSQQQIDGIVHLGARAGVRYSQENPLVYMNTNIIGTMNIFELMQEHNIRHIAAASSSSVYGTEEPPYKEEMRTDTPLSPYAASKKATEVLAHSYHHLYDLDITMLRFFTVYGPQGRPDMAMLRFIRWIDTETPITLYGDGSNARDFTYVDDIAQGVITALDVENYNIINLGGGNKTTSLLALITVIGEQLGKQPIITYEDSHKADVSITSADISHAKKILGWEPKTSLSEGVAKTIIWYKEHKTFVDSLDLN